MTCIFHLVWVQGNKIGDDGANELADALKSNSALTKICLNGATPFFLPFASLMIAVADNKVGNGGAQALAGALKVNKSLVDIGLCGRQNARALIEPTRFV